MDKKNTLLLTVIAVATLLVAVVGATFAYFSLNVQNNSTQTSASVNTGKVGTVTYETTTTNLQLGVSAEDMAKPEADTPFYAVTGEYSEGQYLNSKVDSTPKEIATVTLSGADTGDVYTCGATITVTASGNMLSELKGHTGWVTLDIAGTLGATETIDLSTLETGVGHTVNASGFTLTMDGEDNAGAKKTVTALLKLVNKTDGEIPQSGDQSALAGKSLNVTIKIAPNPEEGSCSVAKAS